ncbi:uncharacterized protein A1O9_10043 [Exophiala aquamarina CBS 119918]|uniref:FAD-binding domain-containing protein n=1 Tax=Exophiala aquamarina CBS 119918 TaxID=1182545 RepID=A0A072P304_9EURO|nr:uncharacterized protein A1O9_10043 [Exophiala aquamarina CBS 119918]KEF53643.1 hypothetical protein A1O9_10043 [Exophiala aquamarina CBS 119918]
MSLDNVEVEYGWKATQVEENEQKITVNFDNGRSLSGDLLVGCDGIHSFVRSALVDLERTPVYTGIATVCGFAELADKTAVPWQYTGLCQSQRGMLMTPYFELSRKNNSLQESWRLEMLFREKDRFGNTEVKFLDPLIEATEHWSLYPLYKLAPKGKWASKRAILLGDSAHAMPPQVESTAHAIEDAIVFARILEKHQPSDMEAVLDAYQKHRRERIDAAYDESVWGWETQKDCGWFSFFMKSWISSGYLWWTASARQKRYTEDVGSIDLD